MHHAPPLIQAFDASNDIATYVPSTFVATGVHHSIVCGARRLLVFESVRKIDLDDAPAVGLFCSHLLPERVLLNARNFKTFSQKISMNDGMGNGVETLH